MNQLKNFSIAIVLVFTVISCQETVEAPKQKLIKVAFQTISESEIDQELLYSADIEPDNTAQIGFAVSGIVKSIAVEEGQYIKEGQLLATLDATSYSNAYQIANSSYEQTLDLYTRQKELYDKGSLPASDFKRIQAQLEQAEANKRMSAKDLSDCKLLAPMSGIITRKNIERGSTAGPNISAFTIIKTDKVYATMAVPEVEVGALRKGMKVAVFVPTLNDTLTGEINIINPQADNISKTYQVKVKLDNKEQLLLPGMFSEVTIYSDKVRKGIVIPATAVVRDADNLTYVFLVNDKHMAVRQRITIGSITGKQDIVVEQGLHSGDKVVVSGMTQLKDGVAVTF
ncbi:efflux RND transporter periplasmic adaptor subunit [Leeuwenhoekiella sp. H156]|uniref:efflux RND transporter periplasmic adaptor subunit n=1 Tax=Leeuwenhoekiella sp. H156 TaxID=3450128 RepID=UPI003FA47987